jgi:hypothetical protein
MGGVASRVCVVMMQRDETRLLRFWWTYHAALFSPENIVILDNNSTDYSVRRFLDDVARKGTDVRYDFHTHADFNNKGRHMLDAMGSMRAKGREFFFPLDCDEFIALRTPKGVTLSPMRIRREIARVGDETLCGTVEIYDNHPLYSDRFTVRGNRKVFGTFKLVTDLDLSYENAAPGRAVATNICYLHLHNRPYAEYVARARMKLLGRLPDFGEETLLRHGSSKAPGAHLARALMRSEVQHQRAADSLRTTDIPAFDDWFLSHMKERPFPELERAPKTPRR